MPDSGIAALTPVTGLNVTLTDRVLSVRINRPSSLNSLTVPILTGIADTLERAAADPVVKVVRLGGVGRGIRIMLRWWPKGSRCHWCTRRG